MEDVCSICLDSNPTMNIITTCCKQYFHKSCYDEWLNYNYLCPLCRHVMNISFEGKCGSKKCIFNINNRHITIIYSKSKKVEIIFYYKIKTLTLNGNKLSLLTKLNGIYKTKFCYFNSLMELLKFYNCLWDKMLECNKKRIDCK